jgi:hypothetical protein
MKKILIFAGILILIAGAAYVIVKKQGEKAPAVAVTDFDSCIAAGNRVLESYPEQCKDAEGKTYTRDIGNELEKTDLIKITSPRPGEKVASPLSITGEARGTWYFEASFPVELQDANGNVLALHYAQAQGEWMTEDFVPFVSEITFAAPASGTKGKLILRKDNPSGLPEHDDSLIIPVSF